MIVQYATGKYVETTHIGLYDTTTSPPTITVQGVTVQVQAAFVARIRAAIDRDIAQTQPQNVIIPTVQANPGG